MVKLLFSIVTGIAVAIVHFSIHQIEEGNVGIYYRGGALLKETSKPGFNFMFPFITTYKQVKTALQEYVIENVQCVTSIGLEFYFDHIKVIAILGEDDVYNVVKKYGVDYNQLLIVNTLHKKVIEVCAFIYLQKSYVSIIDNVNSHLKGELQNHLQEKEVSGLTVTAVHVTLSNIDELRKREIEIIDYIQEKLKEDPGKFKSTETYFLESHGSHEGKYNFNSGTFWKFVTTLIQEGVIGVTREYIWPVLQFGYNALCSLLSSFKSFLGYETAGQKGIEHIV